MASDVMAQPQKARHTRIAAAMRKVAESRKSELSPDNEVFMARMKILLFHARIQGRSGRFNAGEANDVLVLPNTDTAKLAPRK